MRKKTILSKRLRCLLDEIPYTNRLIDVGSDHGYAAAFALENQKAGYVVATDIHVLPAERTEKYLKVQGLSEHSEVHCADGLSVLNLASDDTILISGMGGLEIMKILTDALNSRKGALPYGIRFVFGPQRSFPEFRDFLSQYGFRIEKEIICEDRNHTYVGIISIYTGVSYSLSQIERVIGPDLIRRKPDGYTAYLSQKKSSLTKQSLGNKQIAEVIEFIDHEIVDCKKEKPL